METKTCPKCLIAKPLLEFYVRSDTQRASSWCRSCVKDRAARDRAERTTPVYNPAVDVWSHRRRRYGLTRDDWDAMLAEQGGCCAICREPPEGTGRHGLVVDHDHSTGKVRGILCNRCNRGLGQMRDDPDFLEAAITYLHHGFIGENRCS